MSMYLPLSSLFSMFLVVSHANHGHIFATPATLLVRSQRYARVLCASHRNILHVLCFLVSRHEHFNCSWLCCVCTTLNFAFVTLATVSASCVTMLRFVPRTVYCIQKNLTVLFSGVSYSTWSQGAQLQTSELAPPWSVSWHDFIISQLMTRRADI